jgi:hypothetical protein
VKTPTSAEENAQPFERVENLQYFLNLLNIFCSFNLNDIFYSPRFQPWERKIEITNKELKINNKEVDFVTIF